MANKSRFEKFKELESYMKSIAMEMKKNKISLKWDTIEKSIKEGKNLTGEKKSMITEEENVSGLRTVGKNKLFIDKFWEYNITDTIPRQLSEMNQNKSITRTTIQRSGRFLLMAMLDTEQYFVRSIPEIHRKMSGKK